MAEICKKNGETEDTKRLARASAGTSLRCGDGLIPSSGSNIERQIRVATLYKRDKGKRAVYWVQYKDHTGRRRTVKGFSDKGLSEQLAGRLEIDARLRRTGLVDDQQVRIADHKNAPIEEHLAAFESSLADNTPKHTKLTMGRVRNVVTGCKFTRLADFEQEAVQAFLRDLKKKNEIGHRTYNRYLQAIESFCNWCVATRRLIVSPLVGIERLNAQVDIRHPLRASTQEEFKKLVQSASGSNKRYKASRERSGPRSIFSLT